MQQRRLRLGDIVDDYCPRERRVTNHAIVAMVEDDIKQTRCTTCDTEHEYKQGKMPTLRRKKEAAATAAAYNEVLAAVKAEAPVPAVPSTVIQAREATRGAEVEEPSQPVLPIPPPEPEPIEVASEQEPQEVANGDSEDIEGRVHRRLIRATLPRPENHQVVRPVPEFTMRQPTGRPGKFRAGTTRGIGGRPVVGRGGNANGNSRPSAFGRNAGGRGAQAGRPVGREGHRPARGGGHPRPGKKHSK